VGMITDTFFMPLSSAYCATADPMIQ